MMQFAVRTGLGIPGRSPQRYLWTDAFAVCNFLGLFQETREERLRQLALELIDQVHHTLGRHRDDDDRRGWISGLDDAEGESHPTLGGLRIGKPLGEREPGEAFDEELEWNRDGQYFHYLTQWMHALECASQVANSPRHHRWAVELARAAHAGFTVRPSPHAPGRMHWKMSIDLRYPLVASMGQHDPIAGWVAYSSLQARAAEDSELDLSQEIEEVGAICQGQNLVTSDALGIGGLLSDATRLVRLYTRGAAEQAPWISLLLESALPGLSALAASAWISQPAVRRLAFREFGLSIGLRGAEQSAMQLTQHPRPASDPKRIDALLGALARVQHLPDAIERFWLDPSNQANEGWRAQRDINEVMLATSLAPIGYLSG